MHELSNGQAKKIKAILIDAIAVILIFVICLWNIGILERILAVDEFSYFGIAAAFVGWDWTEIMATSEYYSFGYSLILVPLMWIAKLGVPMALIYKAVIALNAFWLTGIYFLVQYVEKEIFVKFPKTLKCAAALVVTLYIGITNGMNVAWTEIYLCFMFWCIICMLIRVLKKPGYANTFFLLLFSANIFTIHMRAIGVVLALGFILGFYFMKNHRELNKKYIIFTLGTIGILVFAVLGMKLYVTNTIYFNAYATNSINTVKSASTGSVNDLQANISKTKSLLRTDGLLDLFMSVCGKLYYAFSASFLLGAIGAVISFAQLRKLFTGKWQLMQWYSLFALLAFMGEIVISAIFKCLPIYRNYSLALASPETIVFGRYADFVVGGMMLLGIFGIYSIKQYYGAVLGATLIYIPLTMITQYQFDILSFCIGSSNIASFRTKHIPWFAFLADRNRSIVNFAFYAAIISISVLLIIIVAKLMQRTKVNMLALILFTLSIAWGILGASISKDFNMSKIHKEKNVDTVTNLIKVTDEDVPIYWIAENYTTPNSDIEILQWSLAGRSIRVRTVSDLEMLNLEQAIMICYSGDEDTNDVMRIEAENIYSSGTLEVYIEKENEDYDFLKRKALEMDYIADQTENTIDLSTAVTELSYLKPNGNLYFNSLSEGNMVKAKLEGLEEGIYEICFDIKAESEDEEGKLGFFVLEDAAGNVQNSDPINMEEFEGKKRQNIKREITVREGESPAIGIYVYQNTSVKIYSIKYKKIINRV